jgi:hypothetical protein
MEAAVKADLSPGERRLKDKNKRLWIIMAVLGVIGFVPGFLLGYTQNDRLLDAQTVWPAWIVLLLAGTFLVAVPIGAWLLQRQMDELERANHRKAAVVASSVLVMGYPVWLLLWMGAMAPEPSHWVLFAAFYLSFILSWGYFKLR